MNEPTEEVKVDIENLKEQSTPPKEKTPIEEPLKEDFPILSINEEELLKEESLVLTIKEKEMKDHSPQPILANEVIVVKEESAVIEPNVEKSDPGEDDILKDLDQSDDDIDFDMDEDLDFKEEF